MTIRVKVQTPNVATERLGRVVGRSGSYGPVPQVGGAQGFVGALAAGAAGAITGGFTSRSCGVLGKAW